MSGKVVHFEIPEVMGVGFTGYFADTEGNTVGLWQSATPSG
ncbi:hypothetical protein R8Z50_16375 [Longispora sp. K20-0274]